MTDAIFSYLEAGKYAAALAALLLASTALLRRSLDRRLPPKLRPMVPLALGAASWILASATGALDVAEAAVLAIVAALGAMGLHDVGQAAGELLRAITGRGPGAPAEGKRVPDPDVTADERPGRVSRVAVDPGRRTRGSSRALLARAGLLSLVLVLPACAPSLGAVQRTLAGYHASVRVVGGGEVAASARAVAVRAEAGSTVELTAPILPDGARGVLYATELDDAGFAAWRIVLRERDGEDWIRLERIGCEEARVELEELGSCPPGTASAPSVPEVVERRVYLPRD